MLDVISTSVYRHRLEAVAEEMGSALWRTATSLNIKERRDFSCAIFDADARLVAQAAHIPVHLGSMGLSVRSVIDAVSLDRGDVGILNDPYRGGTHLPDITMVAPVDLENERLGYVASRAHYADVGGVSPGSMPLATEIVQEGLIIPPTRIVSAGTWDEPLVDLLAANVRSPDRFAADIRAQAASVFTGARRLIDLCAEHGAGSVTAAMTALIDYSEASMRTTLSRIPSGTYEATDVLEDMEPGGPSYGIRLRLDVSEEGLVADFSASDTQGQGPLNTVHAVVRSAVYYVARCLSTEDIPMNDGCFRPITVLTAPGTVLDARWPAAVSSGNVETSQRVVDVTLRALADALPDLIPAAGQGTMNNVAFGGIDPRSQRPFIWYETLAGGAGGGPAADGTSATQVAMTNTRNSPIEALESELPVRIRRYGLRAGSGGQGCHRGGDGVVRVYEFCAPTRGTVISERRRVAPWGLRGGDAGQPGRNVLIRASGERRDLSAKCQFGANPGDQLRIETPGGGAWGTVSEPDERTE